MCDEENRCVNNLEIKPKILYKIGQNVPFLIKIIHKIKVKNLRVDEGVV